MHFCIGCFARIPFLIFCLFFCHRNQLVPRSLLRFEVPRSANKAAICRVGCCVAVCHVPRRHEIAFRSKRAKMAREERITCICVLPSMCVCGKCDACTSHAASLCTLQTFARVRARLWSANGRRNCAWITPTARFALSVSLVFETREKKKEGKKKEKKNADRPAF